MAHIVLTYQCNQRCGYCYARDLEKDYKEITLENFKLILKWLENQNIKNFSLIGGEPTIHSKFNAIIEIIRTNNYNVQLITNGLYREDLDLDCISSFFINLNPDSYYSKDRTKLLDKNIRNLAGKKITFRYNISSPKQDFGYLFNACLKYNVKTLSYSISTPNMSKSNKYFTEFEGLATHIIGFLDECTKNGIKASLSRPIPLCAFSKRQRYILNKKYKVFGTCNPIEAIYIINPDLSVYPCTTLHIKGPKITEFNSEKEIIGFYRERISSLKWNNDLLKKCSDCVYKKRRQCHGGCLTYKL